jgi:hypothetical protein
MDLLGGGAGGVQANNMCTIVIKAFRNIKAAEIPQDINKLHLKD